MKKNKKKNIILVYGWGITKKIWQNLIKHLKKKYNIFILEICKFLEKNNLNKKKFNYIVDFMYNNFDKNSIWIGWSIGGLFTMKIGLNNYNKNSKIITICSSPCFLKKKSWEGIKKNKISNIFKNLLKNYNKTIKNFFIKSSYNKEYIKKIFINQKIPKKNSIKKCFNIMIKTDIKNLIKNSKSKIFRIYGEFDNIVPKKICKNIYIKKNNEYFIIKKSGHIPFLTHTKQLSKIIHYILKKK
ncbi:hypothetical protein RJK19_01875 [Buchnera aphidicola (Ceratovacuna keduensis)]|uniref:hypothetical protein n=1 Tax=Buchnera aphidicola TaxID=9 RepID=UPI0031B8944B